MGLKCRVEVLFQYEAWLKTIGFQGGWKGKFNLQWGLGSDQIILMGMEERASEKAQEGYSAGTDMGEVQEVWYGLNIS